jgi:hypothetical protein
MTIRVRREFAGRHVESGHHWENDGDVLDVEDGLASRLLAEPAVKMYTLVEHGATVDVERRFHHDDRDRIITEKK